MSQLICGHLVVAIGVPILLAYVYGVVPISLCRGGTCGVKNDNGMLSFDFGRSDGGDSGMLCSIYYLLAQLLLNYMEYYL